MCARSGVCVVRQCRRRKSAGRTADRQRHGQRRVQSEHDGGVQFAAGRHVDDHQGKQSHELCRGTNRADQGRLQNLFARHEKQPDRADLHRTPAWRAHAVAGHKCPRRRAARPARRPGQSGCLVGGTADSPREPVFVRRRKLRCASFFAGWHVQTTQPQPAKSGSAGIICAKC